MERKKAWASIFLLNEYFSTVPSILTITTMQPHTVHKPYSLSLKKVSEKLKRQASPSKLPTKEKKSVDLQWWKLIHATHAVYSGLNSDAISSRGMKTCMYCEAEWCTVPGGRDNRSHKHNNYTVIKPTVL